MLKTAKRKYSKITVIAVLIFGIGLLGFTGKVRYPADSNISGKSKIINIETKASFPENKGNNTDISPMPVYGNWRNFSTEDGLSDDHTYCVKIDGERVLVGTHEGLAVYEEGKWKTYTTTDGLAHNGIIAIDVSEQTGDVWLGTMGGLSRWSGGIFENFTQMNSGMPNDLIYSVICDGKDVWVATGGGAGRFDTFTKQWNIFTEKNAPMHEPWTYGICEGDGKIFIAAWGGVLWNTQRKLKNSGIMSIRMGIWKLTFSQMMV